MTNLILDDEEQKLLAAFEAEEFESVLTDERKADLAKTAEASIKKINVSISEYPLGI